MANQQLINVAGKVAESKNIYKGVGENISKGIQEGIDFVSKSIKKRDDDRKKADAKVATYLDKMPDGSSLEKIPPYAKEKVAAFLSNARDKYAKYANSLRDLDPQDEEYQNQVMEMNKITSSMANLNNQFKGLLLKKTEYLTTSDNGEISNGNKGEDIDFLSNIYTDATDMELSEDGTLSFNRNGASVSMDDLPKYIRADYDTPIKIGEMGIKLYNAGVEWTPQIEENTEKQFRNQLRKAGRDTLISLAADDTLGDEDGMGLGITNELLHDPEREDELTDIIVANYMAGLKEQAIAGYNAKNRARDQRRQERKDDRIPQKANYILDSEFLQE